MAGSVVALTLCATVAAEAQAIIRAPAIALPPRVVIAPRAVGQAPVVRGPAAVIHVNPVVGARAVNVARPPHLVGNVAPRPHLPGLHTPTNFYPSCGTADRSGECFDPAIARDGNGSNGTINVTNRSGNPRRNAPSAAINSTTVDREIIAEIDGTLNGEQAEVLARRHGLRRVDLQIFPLIGATIGRFRIADNRSFDVASRDLATDTSVRSVQPNYLYYLQEQKAARVEGDPAQYVLAKLRLPEAHQLAHGTGIKVAVIDSAIDPKHRELTGSIVDSFDALGSSEGPHVHGTGIAGAIAAHARLSSSAPAAQIIAIRAFGSATRGAQSNSFIILKALDYAVQKQARIINMSFAGPNDSLIERGLGAVAARDIVMVAAAGNAGEKSPPLYPGADPHVIAVSAADAQDHLITASNRGGYVAVTAPGSDIFLPAPDDKYQVTSGTSFSAAYVSGVAALMLERNPALTPDELRVALTRTARDLGTPGRDDLFGAGEVDAFAAAQAASTPTPAALASTSPQPSIPSTENPPEAHPAQASEPPVLTATPAEAVPEAAAK